MRSNSNHWRTTETTKALQVGVRRCQKNTNRNADKPALCCWKVTYRKNNSHIMISWLSEDKSHFILHGGWKYPFHTQCFVHVFSDLHICDYTVSLCYSILNHCWGGTDPICTVFGWSPLIDVETCYDGPRWDILLIVVFYFWPLFLKNRILLMTGWKCQMTSDDWCFEIALESHDVIAVL